MIIYIGKCYVITPAIMQVTATLIVLALATLGDMPKVGLFLFMSPSPRWPRQVLFHVTVAGKRQGYCVTFANVNTALEDMG
jgi:hypothetical protein